MEGCSNTEKRKSQKPRCLQAQFGWAGAAASNQGAGFLKILVGNIKIVRNLVLRQLTKSAGLLVGIMGFQQGFDAVLLKNTHLGVYGFYGITRKYTAMRKKIKTGVHTRHPQIALKRISTAVSLILSQTGKAVKYHSWSRFREKAPRQCSVNQFSSGRFMACMASQV